jgi:hypothetical protein
MAVTRGPLVDVSRREEGGFLRVKVPGAGAFGTPGFVIISRKSAATMRSRGVLEFAPGTTRCGEFDTRLTPMRSCNSKGLQQKQTPYNITKNQLWFRLHSWCYLF